MKQRLMAFVGMMLFFGIGLCVAEHDIGVLPAPAKKHVKTYPPQGWVTSYPEAMESSRKTGKPVFALFTGSDWCPPCIMLEQTILSQPTFLDYAKKELTLLFLDYPRMRALNITQRSHNQRVAAQYGVQAFPTIVILNSNGIELGRTGSRQMGPDGYVKHLKDIVIPSPITETGPEGWEVDMDKATKLASETNKTMLLYFCGSDWAAPCKKMKEEIFSKKEYKTFAKENLISVALDFPQTRKLSQGLKMQNNRLAYRYAVKYFPTIILTDAQGKVIARTSYKAGGANAYVKHLQEFLKQ